VKLLMSISANSTLSNNEVFDRLCHVFARMRRTFSRTHVPTNALLEAILRLKTVQEKFLTRSYAELSSDEVLEFTSELSDVLDSCVEHIDGAVELDLEDFQHESYNIWRVAVTDKDAMCGLPTDYPSIQYIDDYLAALRTFVELIEFAHVVRTSDVRNANRFMLSMSKPARHLVPTSTIHLLT